MNSIIIIMEFRGPTEPYPNGRYKMNTCHPRDLLRKLNKGHKLGE